jgi:hypothetical protein
MKFLVALAALGALCLSSVESLKIGHNHKTVTIDQWKD